MFEYATRQQERSYETIDEERCNAALRGEAINMRDYDTLSFLRSSRLLTRFDVPNLPFENRWHHDLITDLFIRVDETCADLDMKAEKNILPFTTNNRAFNAESGTLFDLGKFISVDRACFVVAWALAKSIVPIAFRDPNDPPTEIDLAVLHMTARSIGKARDLLAVPRIKNHWLCDEYPERVFEMTDRLELFIVAHEYGHLVREGARSRRRLEVLFNAFGEERCGHHEFFADAFAQRILLADLKDGAWAFGRIASAIVFFDFLTVLEERGLLPCQRNHPSSRERATNLVRYLSFLIPEDWDGQRYWTLLHMVRARLDLALQTLDLRELPRRGNFAFYSDLVAKLRRLDSRYVIRKNPPVY